MSVRTVAAVSRRGLVEYHAPHLIARDRSMVRELLRQFLAICRRDWPATLAIVATNAVPAASVLWLHFSVFALFLLFWLENVVMLAIDVLSALIARPKKPLPWGEKILDLLGFLLFYSVALAGFLWMIVGVFGFGRIIQFQVIVSGDILRDFVSLIEHLGIVLPIILMASIHLVRFGDFVLRRRYQGADVGDFVGHAVIRYFVLLLVLMIGGVGATMLGSPLWALFVLVIVKTVVEIITQLYRED